VLSINSNLVEDVAVGDAFEHFQDGDCSGSRHSCVDKGGSQNLRLLDFDPVRAAAVSVEK